MCQDETKPLWGEPGLLFPIPINALLRDFSLCEGVLEASICLTPQSLHNRQVLRGLGEVPQMFFANAQITLGKGN